ncbi:tRNA (adenosine(37)-N6)-dimethylallyltransferase MiaA [Bifidobacterium bombi]|uniref:tRNA dimethylallyltransferase n=1 Tax=Bifidobacterium bombi DSM 19703 TaxID=1341695 RepID=A0A080N4I0_9BIFI|nr:tRNA delta(2)-isopentenylpyrophosphate transferase [Bifidobacterium bombi DSM 19703]
MKQRFSVASLGRQTVVSIVGPTACGKTGLGVALARLLARSGNPAQIVNADAYQMYRGMDVGTAKATWAERQAVTHHLIDIIDPEETMTAARFQLLARREIDRLASLGIRPILVGGSGLYARAAIDDITFPGTDGRIRAELERRAEVEGAGALFEELLRKDPLAAAHMDPRNQRRTIRALEVIAITGHPYSATLPRYRYVMPAVQIGLDMPRESLDRRIDERTKSMRDHGFVDEVRRIRPRLGPTASRALGYGQICRYLDGECTEEEAFDDIARKTKRLARKQMGWFGRDPRIHWLDALSPDLVEQTADIVLRADAGDFLEAEGPDGACEAAPHTGEAASRVGGGRSADDGPGYVVHHLGDIGGQ